MHYSGDVLERGDDFVCPGAIFGSKTRDYDYLTIKKGDIFTEWFYSTRWYKVFKIEDVDTDKLKGYYCNVTRPARISENDVRSDDLALDVFVRPDGSMLTPSDADAPPPPKSGEDFLR